MGSKGKATKATIQECAYQLFVTKGFKEVTMQDICEASGLSRGGLYRHYGSTRQIFSEVISNFLQSQEDAFHEGMKENVSAVVLLQNQLDTYVMEMMDQEHSLTLAIMEFYNTKQPHNNVLSLQYMASYQSWKSLISYGIIRGEFKEVDAKSIFDLLVFAYQGVRMYSRLMEIDKDT